MTILNSEIDAKPFSICEWIAQFFLPNLYSHLNTQGFYNLFDFIQDLNTYNEVLYLNTSHTMLSHKENLQQYFKNCSSILKDITQDFTSNLILCYKIESNIFYFEWLFSLFTPLFYCLLTLFLLPSFVVILLYTSSFFLFVTKHWNKLKSAYYAHDLWQASYKSLAVFWETTGAIWHGHEIVGLENIPDTGPALLIYYHAAMPIDYYYVHCKVMLYKNRRMKVVADRFLFKVPGLASLLEAFEVTPGSLDTCVELLKEGNMLSISPGGVREALFSDHNYEVIWGARAGFAKVAKEAQVPIIPMFTENSREALRTLPFFRKFFRYIYEKTRLPLVPIYGMFPVKLRTYIGEPIEFDDTLSAEELKEKTKRKIEEMIQKHQRLPGSIFHAILDRFRTKHEKVN